MQDIIDALHKAAGEVVPVAASELRSHAHKDGWDKASTKAIHATYVDGEFVSSLTGKHRDSAFVHEFGDENNAPKASVRRGSKSTPKTEQAFLSRVEAHLKGVL